MKTLFANNFPHSCLYWKDCQLELFPSDYKGSELCTFNYAPQGLALGKDGEKNILRYEYFYFAYIAELVPLPQNCFHFNLYIFLFCSLVKMINVTASLTNKKILINFNLCIKDQGQKSKNEAWGKVDLRSDSHGFCICQKKKKKNRV